MVLSIFYGLYLRYGHSERYYPDYFTHQVAQQSEWLVTKLGYESSIEPHPDEASMKLSVEQVFVARVVEGCNAVSVIILFASFVLAFFQGVKRTFLFITIGILLIYVLNIVRIAILSIGLYAYPEYRNLLHDIVFPGIIYGLVVLLWIYWVRSYKTQAT